MFFKQAYGNMSCPRHIGEGQEVQEHQGTWKNWNLSQNWDSKFFTT